MESLLNELGQIGSFVITNVWTILPMFMISILLSVLVHFLKLDGVIRRVFKENMGKAILLATLVGAFSPFCSCTVVPVIAGLLLSGVPLPPIMAFWIASPTMDPEIFALSVGFLGWQLAIIRLLAALVLSLAAGYITLGLLSAARRLKPVSFRLPKWVPSMPKASGAGGGEATWPSSPALAFNQSPPPGPAALPVTSGVLKGGQDSIQDGVHNCSSGSCQIPVKEEHWLEQLKASFRAIDRTEFFREVGKQSWSIGRWLLLAFVLEALILRFVAQDQIASLLGENNPLAVPLSALVGIPLYLNNITALPIVSGLLDQGMQPGVAIAFLIAGPVTTVPAMAAVYGVVSKRIFALYLGLGLFGAMALGYATNLWLG